MRKSGAPSQASNRPRFISPLLQNRQATSSIQKDPSTERSQTVPRNDVLQVLQKSNLTNTPRNDTASSKEADQDMGPVVKKPRFQPPTTTPRQAFQIPAIAKSGQENVKIDKGSSSNCTESRYLNVVWCKRSNKKHKKWEGDAILVTSGRSVTLYDTEGKEIGKSSGYKSGELSTLKEDETLFVGGKEIQVMGVITEEQFKSGKCFTGASSVPASSPPRKMKVPTSNKPFSKPLLSSQTATQVTTAPTQQLTPRHDPTISGALVLPRPSQEHQWKWNKKSLQVLDVVVDPYLSYHLRPHQREGVTFLYECVMGFRSYGGFGAILADDMGLGKTLQCISLIWTLHKQGPYGGKPIAKRTLIVTPGSLVKNWVQEFKKWLGFERLQVYAVSSDKKIEEFMKTSMYPVLVISYEMFVRVYEQIQQMSFDLVVCDEGHRLKNTAIKTTSLIMSLPTQRRIVLTGTPIQNDLQEFYSIVEFCNPGVFGSSAAFRRIYEDPIVRARQPGATPTEISLGEERGAELSRMTQMFVLRRTQEINNKYLPPKCEIVVFCYPSELQLRLYQQLLRCQLIRSCLAGRLSGSPHLICIGALKQLCNHPALVYQKAQKHRELAAETEYDENSSVYKGLLDKYPTDFSVRENLEAHSGKLAVLSLLLQRLRTLQEKIVVVSNHTKTLDLIEGLCDGYSFKCLRLDGQTPVSKRQELVQRFNNKHMNDFVFLLSSKAGGVGLNLIGASRLVLYDIDWNPANDLQAMARVWRDGQKKKVHIYRLLTTGTIEEKVYQRQICKQGLSGSVIDAREKKESQFSLEDLRDLFSVNTNTTCDTHDLLNCDCDIETGTSVTEQAHDSVVRPCQLGVATKHKKRNLGMDELMDWKHSPCSAVKDHPDWYLQDAAGSISYLFYSEIQNTNTS